MSAPVFIFPEDIVRIPLAVTFPLSVRGPVVLIVRSLKVSPVAFVIVCGAVPLKVTFPLLGENVPVLFQLPATLKLPNDTPVRLPEIVILLKLDCDVPLKVVVPLKFIVPLLWVKVPLFAQLPATEVVPLEAVRVPEIVTLLKLVAVPLMVLEPLKVTVPPLCANVPLFVQLPATLKLTVGAVNVPDMVILLNEFVEEPVMLVVPSNSTVLLWLFRVPELLRFPARLILKLLALAFNILPVLIVKAPFTSMAALKVLVLPPETVRLK